MRLVLRRNLHENENENGSEGWEDDGQNNWRDETRRDDRQNTSNSCTELKYIKEKKKVAM